MKQRALDTVLGKVARSLSLVEWKTFNGGNFKRDDLYYHLNVQPNLNDNATEFWQKVIRKLFYEDNDCLIIVTKEDYFLVADDFQIKEFAVYPNIYSDIVVNGLNMGRSFSETEVIHLKYENTDLKRLVHQLDDSYGDLFARLIQVAMRTNQVRATAKLTGSLSKQKNAQSYLQTFVDKVFKAFSNKTVGVVPLQDGMEYEEHSSSTGIANSQVDEMNKISDEYLDAVLQVVGIHPSLIYGDMADVSQHKDEYLINVIQPLVEQISDEINRKFYTPKEYISGNYVKASTLKLRYINIFDIATSAEKLIGIGSFSPDDIREEAGYERLENAESSAYYLTKNIEPLKGGENTE